LLHRQIAAVIPLLATLAGALPVAAAPSIGIFSTGVDASGHLLPDGSVDPRWTVQNEPYDHAGCLPCDGNSPSGGPFLGHYNGASYVGGPAYLPTAFPGGPSFYNLNTPTAGLIAWDPYNASSYQPFTYRTTFNLGPAAPNHTSIVLTMASDDDAELAVNGVLVPSTYEFRTGLHTFVLDSGFVAGTNTLDVVAYNEGGAGGIFVAIDSATVPEPATFGVLSAGVLGLGVVRRRRG
jgi:hypothetical protein